MVFENAILFSPLPLPLFLNVREALEQKNCPYFRSSQMCTCRCVPTGERIALRPLPLTSLGLALPLIQKIIHINRMTEKTLQMCS